MIHFLLMLSVGCDPGAESKPPIVAACDPSSGNICTWAGTGDAAFYGENLPKEQSMFYFPVDIELSELGDTLIIDWNNHRIRSVDAEGLVHTEVGTPFVGDGDPVMADLSCPGVDALTVNLNHPTDAVYMRDGRILFASWHTHKLRLVDPLSGLSCVHCGTTPGFVGDNGEDASTALMNQPKAVLTDANDNIYFLDSRNGRIRKLSADFTIDTFGGDGTFGYSGDGGPVDAAVFNFPTGPNPTPAGALAFNADESVMYVADALNHRIRAVDMATGIIDTVVGTGTAGFSGDGGSGPSAMVNEPRDLEVGPDGRVYFVDTANERIRVWDPTSDRVETLAGDGESGFAGDGGPALDARFSTPSGLDLDMDGNVYVADTFNHRIRVIYR